MISDQLPWKPDLSLTVDAGFSYISKPDCLSAHVATDPHVLDYTIGRKNSDFFFNMQYSYLQPKDILLPYAFDPTTHFPTQTGFDNNKEYDAVLIGLHYPNRNEWVSRLQAKGIKVNYRIGDIYDEYREENNKAWIGLDWSSLQDVNARVFEMMAMRLVPILNRLPGLDYMGFEDGQHYLGFSSMEEAVSQVQWAISHREFAEQIALNAYQFVNERGMTWDSRVRTILETTGLL
jgi:spore maturation protein CgeB